MCKEHNHDHSHNCCCEGHSHDHEHTHEHMHDHSHEGCSCGENLSKDEQTLRVLLAHWIQHNKSHSEDFEKWVEKAHALGKDETALYIKKAVEAIEKANTMLYEAKKHM